MTDRLTPEQWERRKEAVLERLAFLNALYPPPDPEDDDGEPQ